MSGRCCATCGSATKSRVGPGSLRNWASTATCSLPMKRTFRTKESSTLSKAKSAPARERRASAACSPTKIDALASGLFVRVRIPASKPYRRCLFPSAPWPRTRDIKFVYVVGDDGVATRRNVELGTQRGDMRIITSRAESRRAGDRQRTAASAAGTKGGSRRRSQQRLQRLRTANQSSRRCPRLHGRMASDRSDSPHGEVFHQSPDLRGGHLGHHHAGRRHRRDDAAGCPVSGDHAADGAGELHLSRAPAPRSWPKPSPPRSSSR